MVTVKKSLFRVHALFLCIFTFSFFCFSCSDSEADLISATSTLIFDYSSEDSAPVVRLAVFFQVANEVQRTDHFEVTNNDTGYTWSVSKPGIFTGLNRSYAYSISLSAPEGENIPKGAYTATYYDAAGNEDKLNFSVDYDDALLSSKGEECRELLKNPVENIALYDDANELLFMGKAKKAWKNNSAILKDYRIAQTIRKCYVSGGNSIICMMPSEKLKTEN